MDSSVVVKWSKCLTCSQRFVEHGRKKFCSGACRWTAWYKRRYDTDKGTPCVYCGMSAGTIDHIPPRSVRPYLDSVGETRFPYLQVPACSECNSALGAMALWTVRERKEFIKRWLEQRYRAELNMPGWTDDEVRELGPGLQLDVVAGLAVRDLVRRRLAW